MTKLFNWLADGAWFPVLLVGIIVVGGLAIGFKNGWAAS